MCCPLTSSTRAVRSHVSACRTSAPASARHLPATAASCRRRKLHLQRACSERSSPVGVYLCVCFFCVFLSFFLFSFSLARRPANSHRSPRPVHPQHERRKDAVTPLDFALRDTTNQMRGGREGVPTRTGQIADPETRRLHTPVQNIRVGPKAPLQMMPRCRTSTEN